MNFTDSPFEKMMKQVPRAYRPEVRKPPPGSPCRGCTFWRGMACVGTCYRDLALSTTSGQLGPKLAGGQNHG